MVNWVVNVVTLIVVVRLVTLHIISFSYFLITCHDETLSPCDELGHNYKAACMVCWVGLARSAT